MEIIEQDCELNSEKMNGRSLIVVSNRLPFSMTLDENGNPIRTNSSGGLVTALTPLICKSNGFWIGWGGKDLTEDMSIPESNVQEGSGSGQSLAQNLKSSQIIPVYYTNDVYNSYYNGMCNATLWPLMHSLPTHATFDLDYWQSYVQVNKNFAQTTFNKLKERQASIENDQETLIWIHDYHLMVMPLMMRNLIEESQVNRVKLAFFLHIPFPSWDILRLIPWPSEILLGLLGCDLIAFHTRTYAQNFLECCNKILGARVDKEALLVEYGNKSIVVKALPLGVPYNWFEKIATESPKSFNLKEKVILGVDRLDYTKGILERIRGYERFLEKYPQFIEKVVFMQIAVPSRTDVSDYKVLKDQIEREIGRIIGRFGTSEWTPIKYLYKNMSQYELAGYYRDAAVALVTPIRDGMNLVAKEYVACQIEDPGVLIISPFTGAGETMTEALTVNPLETNMVADAIKHAFDMQFYERKLRMNALRTREKLFNLDAWFDSFFDACDALNTPDNSKMQSITIDDFKNWLDRIINGYRLTILLDFDGTLVQLESHPDMVFLPEDQRKRLEKLIEFKDVDVCVITGRSLENIRGLVNIHGLHLAASHGMETYLANGEGRIETSEEAFEYKAKVSDLADELTQKVTLHGGWIEKKVFHVVYHYRDTEVSYRQEMIQKAKEIILSFGFEIQLSHFGVEARPPIGWDKGRGSYHILEKLHGYTWADNTRVVYIGDDETDEDAMRALSGLGITFRVGDSIIRTCATHRLSNAHSVEVFLEWAIDFMERREKLKLYLQKRNKCMRKLSGIF